MYWHLSAAGRTKRRAALRDDGAGPPGSATHRRARPTPQGAACAASCPPSSHRSTDPLRAAYTAPPARAAPRLHVPEFPNEMTMAVSDTQSPSQRGRRVDSEDPHLGGPPGSGTVPIPTHLTHSRGSRGYPTSPAGVRSQLLLRTGAESRLETLDHVRI